MADRSLVWETIDREQAYACEAFEVFTDRVRLPDGRESRFDYVSEPPSAVVLPVTVDETVVVLEEYRHAVGRVATGLPGGSMEPEDSDMQATAVRELHEEAGYHAQDLELLSVAEPANGLLDSERHYFKATGCEPSVGTDLDMDESIIVKTIDLETLLEQVLDGTIRDERTITAVLLDECRDEDDSPPSVDRIA